MQLKELKSIFHKELQGIYPKEEINSFFNLLIEHFLKLERFVLVLHPTLVVSKEDETLFFDALSRIKKEEPIQYILGRTHFMGLELKVDASVLIPRPETEELVQWVIESRKPSTATRIKILDIGTGSGCIAVALAKTLPNAEVKGMDLSQETLAVATQNAMLNEVDIEFIHADVLDFDAVMKYVGNYDIIVSNPPYVRESEKVEIENNVKKYEPAGALFVPDDDPLKFYRAIANLGAAKLNPKGQLFLEINQYLMEDTKEILVEKGFRNIEWRKDIFGNFRMLKGTHK